WGNKDDKASGGKDEKASGREDKRAAAPAPPVNDPDKELAMRPVVYRYGKLPTKELPSWFVELDTDKDGQVGLYEWRGKRPLKEFKEYDLNGDGFITAEECLAVQKVQDGKKDKTTLTYVRANADPGSE